MPSERSDDKGASSPHAGPASAPGQRNRATAKTDAPASGSPGSGGKPTDYLANERTFLAWTRTGVALVALGFVVARFGLLLRELAQRAGVSSAATQAGSPRLSSIFGAAIVALAAVLLATSFVRYVHVGRALDQGAYRDSRWLIAVLTVLSVLIALLLVAYLLLT